MPTGRINPRLKEVGQKIHALAISSRGRNALTFAVFLVISAVFWFVLAINDEIQQEFEIPIKLVNVPKDVTLISNPPSTLSVSVKDKGTALVRYQWGKVPVLDINFKDFQNDSRHIYMGETQLTGVVRSFFGQGASISALKPDSISLSYTNHPGVDKKVNVLADVSVSPQYIISGPITVSPDTVKVYSLNSIPASFRITTDTIYRSGLTDTTTIEVNLKAREGMRIIPSTVAVTVPVEPLIAKRRAVPVEVRNSPAGHKVLTFPSTVEVTYLLPMSSYNKDNYAIKAYADYSSAGKKLPLTLSTVPEVYQNTALVTDSVEYLVERR